MRLLATCRDGRVVGYSYCATITTSAAVAANRDDTEQIAAAIAAAVEEQSRATAEIASNIQQASAATREVSSNTNGVSKASVATRNAAGQVLTSAKALTTQTGSLRGTVDHFLKSVHNA